MWGQDPGAHGIGSVIRIIPTRVGTSDFSPLGSTRAKDHPHACGDKFVNANAGNGFKGSSPRVWGQVVEVVKPHYKARIIPTRVGTSHSVGFLLPVSWDHPHACGDKYR